MNSRAVLSSRTVLAAAKVGSLSALWARIDAGEFPRPVTRRAGELYWDAEDVRRAVSIKPAPAPEQREQPQPPSRTRERKDSPRTETRESE